jgi:tetratricopeptide (TPR) repeat protein
MAEQAGALTSLQGSDTPIELEEPAWLRGLDEPRAQPVEQFVGDELPSWIQAEELPAVAPPTAAPDWRPLDAVASAGARQRRRVPEFRAEDRAAAPPLVEEKLLGEAQVSLQRGDLAGAIELYSRMIRKGRNVEETIRDLRDAVYRFPVEVTVWQTLGDAYMRANRLQEALDAYNKAEELLR